MYTSFNIALTARCFLFTGYKNSIWAQPSTVCSLDKPSRVQLSTPAFTPKLQRKKELPMMNAMLRILAVAGLVAATFAALAEFKTCDANAQSVNAFTQAFITADADFNVFSSAFIEAKTAVAAATESVSKGTAGGIAAVLAQAGQGRCVDVAISTESIAIAEAISKASAAITAVVKAEAAAFATAYLSLFAYSQAAVESCSCPANSGSGAQSTTTAFSDLFVKVSSEAQEFFKANVEVEQVTQTWSSAITDCRATPRLCIFNNRFVSSVGGSCNISVNGSGTGVNCSLVTDPFARMQLGCPS